MNILLVILSLIVTGLIVGALARLALPGKDPMSIGQTILIGIVGALVSGLIAQLVFDSDGFSILLAVVVSAGLVYLVRRSRGGTLTKPAPANGPLGRQH